MRMRCQITGIAGRRAEIVQTTGKEDAQFWIAPHRSRQRLSRRGFRLPLPRFVDVEDQSLTAAVEADVQLLADQWPVCTDPLPGRPQ